MREDFNKQLTERERLGHKMKFGDHRNAKLNKVLDEEMSGGKESIHARRRNAKGRNAGRKSFNENLNPLKNFLRVNAGRPWDKIYSEITSTFDKRKVINNHILEHLFDYVELNAVIIDGKPHVLNRYGRYNENPYRELEYRGERYPSYYVDPRDGLLKAPRQTSTRRQREAESAAELKAKQDKMYRRLDDDTHLVLKDGTWWVYKAKAKPPKIMEYTRPAHIRTYEESKAWDALPEEEKQKQSIGKLVDAPMRDKIEPPDVPGYTTHRYWYGGNMSTTLISDDKYFYSRTAASHKLLKAAGVAGTVPAGEVKNLSHREASKYREKKAGKK